MHNDCVGAIAPPLPGAKNYRQVHAMTSSELLYSMEQNKCTLFFRHESRSTML